MPDPSFPGVRHETDPLPGGHLGPCGRIIPTDPDALLHTKEAAYLAGESPRTWEGRRVKGDGCPFVQLSDRSIRYPGPLPTLAALPPAGALLPALKHRYPRRRQTCPPDLAIALLRHWTGQRGQILRTAWMSNLPVTWVGLFGKKGRDGSITFDFGNGRWSVEQPAKGGAVFRNGQGLVALGGALFGVLPSRIKADVSTWLGLEMSP